ncbi:MAG TPA: HNH endonuclease signature motif containing protein [Candidatus Acidoferrales bacterium]|jgi:hypothetical protein|nr:HNH endonuclease signature motif containing protein [Candidatus Acidoferrales bacterium]
MRTYLLFLFAAMLVTVPALPSPKCTSCIRDSKGRIARAASARRKFQHAHPCPATGSATGACYGYVIDHVKPLACGGADSPSNMQWQTNAAAKAKDKLERRGCR